MEQIYTYNIMYRVCVIISKRKQRQVPWFRMRGKPMMIGIISLCVCGQQWATIIFFFFYRSEHTVYSNRYKTQPLAGSKDLFNNIGLGICVSRRQEAGCLASLFSVSTAEYNIIRVQYMYILYFFFAHTTRYHIIPYGGEKKLI